MKNKQVIKALITGSLIMLMLGINPSWSVLSKAMVSTDGWTYSEASLPYTICGFGYAFGVLVFGFFYHKYGPKLTVLAGAVLTTIGLVGCSVFYRPGMVAVCYGGLYGIGQAACYTAAITPMLKWAPAKKRSIASAIATTGFGLAGVYTSVIAGELVTSYSVRTTFIIIAAFTGVVLIIVGFFVKDPPMEYILSNVDSDGNQTETENLTLKQAAKKPAFYMLIIMFMFVTGGGAAVMSNIASIVSFQNDSVNPFVFSTIATFGNCAGRIIGGYLGGRFPRKWVLGIQLAFMAVLILLFQFMHSSVLLVAATLIIMISYGTEMALLPVLITDNFGVVYYSEIYGVIISASCIYNITGPFLVGKLADHFGNFNFALLLCGTYVAIGSVIAMCLPKRQQ